MSLRRTRRAFLLGGSAVLLGACGLRPLYGTAGAAGGTSGASVGELMAGIDVAVIADRPGQVLRNRLIGRMNSGGRPDAPSHRLNVTLRESTTRLGILDDQVSTRTALTVAATYTLRDLATDRIVIRDRATARTAFNRVGDEFNIVTAERDARERALGQLADEIQLRIAIYFSDPSFVAEPTPEAEAAPSQPDGMTRPESPEAPDSVAP